MAGHLDNNTGSASSSLRRRLRKMISGGWDFEDKIIKRSNAVGKNEFNITKDKSNTNLDLLDLTAMLNDMPGGNFYEENINEAYEKLANNYKKDNYLEEVASFDEIDFVLTTICDESIIYDEDNMFCSSNLQYLKTTFSLKDDVIKKMDEVFHKIYYVWQFDKGYYAWRLFKEWLTYGKVAFEIIYNRRGDEIDGLKRLDPYSLKQRIKKIDNHYVKYWVQYEGIKNMERELTDNEIVMIDYDESKTQKSYLESILRSFNILRSIEDARVIWGIMHSVMRMRMIVPINTKSPAREKVKVAELRNRYKENTTIDKVSGQVQVNGDTNLPMFKNYIFPSKDGEQVEIEPIQYSLSDSIDIEQLEYFANKYKFNTKIPFSRFSHEEGRGQYSFDTSIENDEIRFDKFKNRLKNTFKELILKTYKIQLSKEIPELKEDKKLWNSINIDFAKNSFFEMLKEMELKERQQEFIENMNSMQISVWSEELDDFQEQPFWSTRYLIEKYMKLSEEELTENERYKTKFKEVKPGLEDPGDINDPKDDKNLDDYEEKTQERIDRMGAMGMGGEELGDEEEQEEFEEQ